MTQVRTFPCDAEDIMRHPNFARGLADVRAGRRFDSFIEDEFWAYERVCATGPKAER